MGQISLNVFFLSRCGLGSEDVNWVLLLELGRQRELPVDPTAGSALERCYWVRKANMILTVRNQRIVIL